MEVWKDLSNDEKKLIVEHPNKALVGLAASNKATEYTIREFGINGLGDRSDAFRHTLWCALMSRDDGIRTNLGESIYEVICKEKYELT